MGWATHHMSRLRAGETITCRPRGHSMTGRVNDGDTCVIAPVVVADVAVGDVVLCRVNGQQYLHLVVAKNGERLQIGNNRGRINGWIGANGLYGRLVRIEPRS